VSGFRTVQHTCLLCHQYLILLILASERSHFKLFGRIRLVNLRYYAIWQRRPCDPNPSGTPPDAMQTELLTQAPFSKYCFRLHRVHTYPLLPAPQSHAAQLFSVQSHDWPLFGPLCFLPSSQENGGSQKFLYPFLPSYATMVDGQAFFVMQDPS